MTGKSDQKESHEEDKDISKEETINEPEETETEEDTKEEISESAEKEKRKTLKLTPSTLFKTVLFLLLIGSLSWFIYYLHNVIQNNLTIAQKIDETIQGINRIQIEQDKIKKEIKSFQNKKNSSEKVLNTVDKLNDKISVLQNEVKVLQVEIKKQPANIPPQQVQLEVISPEKNQPVKAEIDKEPVVKKESNTDARSKVITIIEDSVKIVFKTIENAFGWLKEELL